MDWRDDNMKLMALFNKYSNLIKRLYNIKQLSNQLGSMFGDELRTELQRYLRDIDSYINWESFNRTLFNNMVNATMNMGAFTTDALTDIVVTTVLDLVQEALNNTEHITMSQEQLNELTRYLKTLLGQGRQW